MDCIKLSGLPSVHATWTHLERTEQQLGPLAAIMAIVNATPDSFSDGGQHLDQNAACAYAEQAIQDGATYLDIGGESTRPGSKPVSSAEELSRVLPIIRGIIAQCEHLSPHERPELSIDTSKSEVAEAALKAGVSVVNDVSAGRDSQMFSVVASYAAKIVLMHMQGIPETMQNAPFYHDNVIDSVGDFFEQRIQAALASGIAESDIILDPGIGFGKTVEQNVALLAALPMLKRRFQMPILVGLSRKSFLPKLMGRDVAPENRDFWSHCFHAQLLNQCDILRVHDVIGLRDMQRAQDVLMRAQALLKARERVVDV